MTAPQTETDHRATFLRGLASNKHETVERLAVAFEGNGMPEAAPELRRHAADLRAVDAGQSDEATVARFEKRLALACEAFAPNSRQVIQARANAGRARGALAAIVARATAVKRGGDSEAMLVLLANIYDALERRNSYSDSSEDTSASKQLTAGDASTSLKLNKEFSQANKFTVQFDVDTPGAFCQATVEWRRGGRTIQRKLDVCAGMAITGFADAVTVTVSDVTNLATYPAATPTYNVTATVTRDGRPAIVYPVYTAMVATAVNAATNKTVAVVQGANGFRVDGVVPSTGAAAALTVDLYTAGTIGGTAVKIGSVAITALQTSLIPLMAGVAQLVVTNQSAATANVTVIFGIDG